MALVKGMSWEEYKNNKPTSPGYYLCEIWVNSSNQYGASTEYKILLLAEGGAKNVIHHGFYDYPVTEYYKGNLMEYHEILFWCKIEDPGLSSFRLEIPEKYRKQDTN